VTITKLKNTRQTNGIKQEDLASKTGTALRTLQYYESGKRKPDVETAQRLAKALGVTVPDLFPLPREAN